jgi:hypothetical protein
MGLLNIGFATVAVLVATSLGADAHAAHSNTIRRVAQVAPKSDAPTAAELTALHAEFMQELQALNLTSLAASPRDARATAAVRDIALHTPNHIRTADGSKIKCWVCEHVIEKFVGFAVDHGCDAADGIAISLCEAAGLGPEDPLADACAAALCGACGWFVSDWVDKKIHNGKKLCQHIHWC